MTPTSSPSSANSLAPTPGLRTISGVIERITYVNDKTGYTVARLLPDALRSPIASTNGPQQNAEKVHVGKDQLATIVGTLPGLVAGEALELTGFWGRHQEYGWQFSVRQYRTTLPATLQGIRKYLGSGLIRGIGPRMAEHIVDQFGLETLDVLERSPERLCEVPWLGQRRAERIATAWKEQKAIQAVMLCLHELSVSTNLAVRIYKEFGNAAVTVVKEEPYRLAREVWGIGFKTADKVAQAQGYTHDHPERIKAGILFVLSEACNNGGHTYLPQPELARQASSLLEVSLDQIEVAINALMEEQGVLVERLATDPDGHGHFEPVLLSNQLVSTRKPSHSLHSNVSSGQHVQALLPLPPVAKSGGALALFQQESAEKHLLSSTPVDHAIYLPPFFMAEQSIARHLCRLAALPAGRGRLADLQQISFLTMFDYLTTKEQFLLADRQQQGITMSLTQPVSILTGGPGTGKTTSLRALIRVLMLKKKSVTLAAPTGKAAKRLSEATGIEAQTIHRLLQLRPGGQSAYTQEHPLPADIVIIDEVSMLDTLLMNSLLKGIATGTHLLLVGDADQLPSVGPGRVLADLIASSAIPVTRLEHIFRQGTGSRIATNAHLMNQGLLPVVKPDNSEFFFFIQDEPQLASELIVDLVTRRIPAKFGFSSEQVQVLTPMHRGRCGLTELNERLQKALNPPAPQKAERHYGGMYFRVGDKVLQLRNNYEKEVFNGDSGVVAAVSAEEQIITVRLDEGREVTYDFGELDELTLAYAVSIHKAQGSEYPACVIPLVMEHYHMLERQLIYTAVTRARQLVVLVGSKKALSIAIRNGPGHDRQQRDTFSSAEQGITLSISQLRNRSERYTGLAIRLRQLNEGR